MDGSGLQGSVFDRVQQQVSHSGVEKIVQYGEQEALFTHLAAIFKAATQAVSTRKPGQERYRDVRLVAARQTQTTITAGETADESRRTGGPQGCVEDTRW